MGKLQSQTTVRDFSERKDFYRFLLDFPCKQKDSSKGVQDF